MKFMHCSCTVHANDLADAETRRGGFRGLVRKGGRRLRLTGASPRGDDETGEGLAASRADGAEQGGAEPDGVASGDAEQGGAEQGGAEQGGAE